MKALLVIVNVMAVVLILCLECHAEDEKGDVRHFDTGYDSGDGGGGEEIRTQRTLKAEVDEGDVDASLRASVVKAVKHTRSRKRGHVIRSRSLDDLVTPTQLTFLDLAHLYLPAMTNVSQVCRRDLTALYNGIAQLDEMIKNGTIWPLMMVDSWGKFSDGMLEGNLQQLGFFYECLNVKVYQPPETLNDPFHTINDPSLPLNQASTHQNILLKPPSAHSQPHNLISRTQNQDSYLPQHLANLPSNSPLRHQRLPPKVYEAINLPHRLLRVPPQSSLDPQEPRRPPRHARQALNVPPHPHHLQQDRPLGRYTDLDDEDSTATTTSSPLPLADFSGQYCLVTYAQDEEETLKLLRDERTPALSLAFPLALSLMAYGTCIPSTCTPEELQESVEAVLSEEGLRVATMDCQVEGRRHTLGGAEITGIVLLSVMVALMLLGALADHVTSAPARSHFREGPLQYLLAFSVTTNIKKMFHLETRKQPGVISSIHGIRFISITWVVWGHQFAYSISFSQNPVELAEMSQPTFAQAITNADKSVDTFLMLSGLLVTIGVLGMVNRMGRFSLPLYLFHRVLRLWPPVALSTMLIATLSGLPVTGPYAEQYWSSVIKGCRHRWWADVTFTNNIIFRHLDQIQMDEGEGACCLPHGWYLSVDTQLFLIMPLLLLPLIWWPRKGWMWLLLWTIASVVIPAALIGAYDLWPTTLIVMDPAANLEFTHKVYITPWCRAGPYLVGAWAGYLLHYSKTKPSITRLKPWQVCLGWAAAVSVAFAVLFGLAPYNYLSLTDPAPEMSTAEAALYGGAHRAAWGVAVAWVVVACTWGYGGPVAWILEHPIWQPFSRLSYCIYITSLPIQYMLLYSTKRLTYFTVYGKVHEAAGVLVVTVLVSLFVSLASEAPTLRLEKILLSRAPAERPQAPPTEVTTPPRQESGQGHEISHVTLFSVNAKG